MRRLSAASLALLAALLLVGVAAAGRGDPKQAFTKADQARAKTMVVRATDLAPGFVARPGGEETEVYCKAIDESDLTITGEATSPQYTLIDSTRLFVIASAAQLYRTVKQSNRSWSRGTSRQGLRCLEKLFGATPGMTLRSVRVQSFPKVAPRTIAYRVVMDAKAGGATIRTHSDVIVLQNGRAQLALWVLSGGVPLARDEVVAFARVLAGRMAVSMRVA